MTTPDAQPAIEGRRLTKLFGGVRALDDLSIALPFAAITSIIGPNGSGKSTLVDVLTASLPLDRGVILVSGRELHRLRSHESRDHGLTRTFQGIRLFGQLSVLDNLLIVMGHRSILASLLGRVDRRRLDQARRLLDRFGLDDRRNDPAESLSYGQRKLLEIARALATGATVFLFDEPFAGVATRARAAIEASLLALREAGCCVVLIEHDMAAVRDLSDVVIVLDAGTSLASGQAVEVLARPDVIEAYLGD